jgi:hypothetical protein
MTTAYRHVLLLAVIAALTVAPPTPASARNTSDPRRQTGPVLDASAPLFWDDQTHQRVGADADRFELDDPTTVADQSSWYYLSYTVPGDRLRMHDHNPATTQGSDSAIAHSEDVAWHVATLLLGDAHGFARIGELPAWARPRTGGTDGGSGGLLFALADLDVLTPGPLAGQLRVAATGAIGSDGVVTAVRMVDAKLAAARLAHVGVMFAPDFPDGVDPVVTITSHTGPPTPERTIGDWLNTTSYEAAGRAAAHHPDHLALVRIDDVRQALAWLCGRTNQPTACRIVHTAAAVALIDARPYTNQSAAPTGAPPRNIPS